MAAIEQYLAPRSLAEAAAFLAGGPATILAGGTDLMPQSRSGKLKFAPRLVNIQHVPELRGVTFGTSAVRIGALTSISELHGNRLVRERLPILWDACDHFASPQIRNAATLGGNLCNASPAGDTLVPLVVLDARVVLAGAAGGELAERVVPVADFLVGPGRTRREPQELVVAIEIPMPAAGWVDRFVKFGTRAGLDISAVAVGLGGVWRDGTLGSPRIAFGAVAPTVIRAPAAERVLGSRALDAATIEETVRTADAEIRPISDVRATDWYRHELARNLLRRMLNDVHEA